MTFDQSPSLVVPADYDQLKQAVRLSGEFTEAARKFISRSGRDAELLQAITQEESADAQYIEWKMGQLPRRTPEEIANYNFFQLALYDIFAEIAERANIQDLERYVPKEMATREMVQFLTSQERFALALVTLDAAP